MRGRDERIVLREARKGGYLNNQWSACPTVVICLGPNFPAEIDPLRSPRPNRRLSANASQIRTNSRLFRFLHTLLPPESNRLRRPFPCRLLIPKLERSLKFEPKMQVSSFHVSDVTILRHWQTKIKTSADVNVWDAYLKLRNLHSIVLAQLCF